MAVLIFLLSSPVLCQSNGSVDVHINVDQTVQSESRLRLLLAENLLRDTDSLIHRLEVRSRVGRRPPAERFSAHGNHPCPLIVVWYLVTLWQKIMLQ